MVIRTLVGAAAIFILMVSLQVDVDARKQEAKKSWSRPFVPPRPDLARIASLGYQTMIADAYWLSAIQYFAEASDNNQTPDDLYYYTDFITDLDPRFCFAYYFTGLNFNVKDGKQEFTRSILEKGKKNCPDYWKIPFQLGFFYYYSLDEYELAAENFDRAYQLTRFKNYALLAARIRSQGGRPETAIQLLSAMAEGTDDPEAKRKFSDLIAGLRARVILNELNQAVDNFFLIEGRYPSSPGELIRIGLIAGVPDQHPVPGHRFKYNPEKHTFNNDPPIYTGVYNRGSREGK